MELIFLEQYNCAKCFYLGKYGCKRNRETYSKGKCPDFKSLDEMMKIGNVSKIYSALNY